MSKVKFANARYTYMHDVTEEPQKIVDCHHIIAKVSNALVFFVFITFLTLLALALCLYSGTEGFSLSLFILFGARFVYSIYQKQVVKESVVIIPAFGIQLETRYRSGKVVHNFVPVDDILKPVLNENVTPFTCYWSLGFIIRDKEELVLAFKNIRPPVKMLAPVWKALCVATNTKSGNRDSCVGYSISQVSQVRNGQWLELYILQNLLDKGKATMETVHEEYFSFIAV
ncbi:hypothetical protein ACFE04_012190 [Oxalis oulophora]